MNWIQPMIKTRKTVGEIILMQRQNHVQSINTRRSGEKLVMAACLTLIEIVNQLDETLPNGCFRPERVTG